jgi:hypothetical protein
MSDTLTAVEQLRAAARSMRERAQAATPGPWSADGFAVEQGNEATVVIAQWMRQDAEHIASWHPVVALAVAAWLDWAAHNGDLGGEMASALAVARTYLGSGS